MTRPELLAINSGIVRSVVAEVVAASPDAVLVCVTNPLDIMTQLAWRLSGFDSGRVLGMGGVLDSARFAYFIAAETGADISQVEALVMGSHGDAMVPMPRLSTVDGRALTDILDADRVAEVVRRTIFGGAEVVSLLKTGSAFYAPGTSVASMAQAILDDAGATMPSCVRLEGQYGLGGVYLSVPAVLGRGGVVEVLELDLTDGEIAALRHSTEGIAEACAALETGS